MQENWWNNYIGIPYLDKGRDKEGLDCWGLVRLVYSNEFNIDLPSFADQYTHENVPGIAELIAMHQEGWVKVDIPKSGDTVLMKSFGEEAHIGVVTLPGFFLHVRAGNTSIVESLESTQWKKRIIGIYRYKENANIGVQALPSPLSTKRISLEIKQGSNLLDVLKLVEEKEPNSIDFQKISNIVLLHNGTLVPQEKWGSTYPAITDTIEYRLVAKGGDTFKFIAVIAIAIVAWYAAPYIVGSMMGVEGAAFGAVGMEALAASGMSAFAASASTALVAGAINMVGGLLINAIFPTRPPSVNSPNNPGSPEAYKMLNGQQNAIQQYSVIPVVLGKFKYSPPVGAQTYSIYKPSFNYLNMLLVWGYGPLEISNISMANRVLGSVGSVKQATYDGFVNSAGDLTAENDVNSIYGKEIEQVPINLDLDYIILRSRYRSEHGLNIRTGSKDDGNSYLGRINASWAAGILTLEFRYVGDASGYPHGLAPGLQVYASSYNSTTTYMEPECIGTISTIPNEYTLTMPCTTSFIAEHGASGSSTTLIEEVRAFNYIEKTLDEPFDSIDIDIYFPQGNRSITTEGGNAGDINAAGATFDIDFRECDINTGVPVGSWRPLSCAGSYTNYSLTSNHIDALTLTNYNNFTKISVHRNAFVVNRYYTPILYQYAITYFNASTKEIATEYSSITNDLAGGLPLASTDLATAYSTNLSPINSQDEYANPILQPVTSAEVTNWKDTFRTKDSLVTSLATRGLRVIDIIRFKNNVFDSTFSYSPTNTYNVTATGTYSIIGTVCTCTILNSILDMLGTGKLVKLIFNTGTGVSKEYLISTVISNKYSNTTFTIPHTSMTTSGNVTLQYSNSIASKDTLIIPSTISNTAVSPYTSTQAVISSNTIIYPKTTFQFNESDPTIALGKEGQNYYKRKDAFLVTTNYKLNNQARYQVRIGRNSGYPTHDIITAAGNSQSMQNKSLLYSLTGKKNTRPIILDNIKDSNNTNVSIARTAVLLMATDQVNGNSEAITGVAHSVFKDYSGSTISSISSTSGTHTITTREPHRLTVEDSVRFKDITNANYTFLNHVSLQTTVHLVVSVISSKVFTITTGSATIALQNSGLGDVLLARKFILNKATWLNNTEGLLINTTTPAYLIKNWVCQIFGTGNTAIDGKNFKVKDLLTSTSNTADYAVYLTPYGHTVSLSNNTVVYNNTSTPSASIVSAINNTDWILRTTSNPASLFRGVLQHQGNIKRVADSKVDLTKLEYWHKFCRYKGFEFNAVVAGNPVSVDAQIRDIAAAGRASSTYIDGRWSVIIEEPRTQVIQHFTPYNSWGFEGNKVLPKIPHAFKIPIYNSANDWAQEEVHVFNNGYYESTSTHLHTLVPSVVSTTSITLSGTPIIDGYQTVPGNIVLVIGQGGSMGTPNINNGIYTVAAGAWTRHTSFDTGPEFYLGLVITVGALGTSYANTKWICVRSPVTIGTDTLEFSPYIGPATVYETLNLPGVTSASQATRLGRFHLAQIKLRPEKYSLNADMEHIVCTRGDLVKVTHDIPMWGTGSGRISSVSYNNTTDKLTVNFSDSISIKGLTTYKLRIRIPGVVNLTDSSVIFTCDQAASDSYVTSVVISLSNNAHLANSFNSSTGAELSTNIFLPDTLFMLGETSLETNNCIVLSIEPMDNITARLTLVDYSPEIYTYADSDDPLPEFRSKLTTPILPTNAPIGVVPTIQSFISDERTMERVGPNSYKYSLQVVFGKARLLYPSSSTYDKAMANVSHIECEIDHDTGQVASPSIDDSLVWQHRRLIPKADSAKTTFTTDIYVNNYYRVRARYVNKNGLAGPWCTAFEYVGADKTTYLSTFFSGTNTDQQKVYPCRTKILGGINPPRKVGSLTCTPRSSGLFLNWSDNPEPDVTSYEIRTADSDWGLTKDTTNGLLPHPSYVKRVTSSEIFFVPTKLADGSISRITTYYVRARDALGNYSTTSSSVVYTQNRPVAIASVNIDNSTTIPFNQTTAASLLVDWSETGLATSFDIAGYEIRSYGTSGAPNTASFGVAGTAADGSTRIWKGSASQATIKIIPANGPITYYIRPYDITGTYASTSNSIDITPSTNPSNVTGATIAPDANLGKYRLDWVDSPAGDFWAFEVRTSNPANWTTDTTGRVYRGQSSACIVSVPNPSINGSKTFYIKAQDIFGRWSTTATSISHTYSIPGNITFNSAKIVPFSSADSTTTRTIEFDWTPPSSGTFPITYYEIHSTDANWGSTTGRLYYSSNSIARISGVSITSNTTYYLKALTSAGVYNTIACTLDVTPATSPIAPTSATITESGNKLLINWSDSTSGDLKEYEVRTSNPVNWTTDTTGKVYRGVISQCLIDVPNQTIAETKTFYIKAQDIFGKWSDVVQKDFVYSLPGNVSNILTHAPTFVIQGGTTRSIILDWDPPAASSFDSTMYYEIRGVRTGGADPLIGDFNPNINISAGGSKLYYYGTASKAQISNLSASTDTKLFIRARNSVGVYSVTQVLQLLTAKIAPTIPGTPTIVADTVTGKFQIDWATSTDDDIAYYEVRLNNANWGTADANRVYIGKSSICQAAVYLPNIAGNKTYYLRATDIFNLPSAVKTITFTGYTLPTIPESNTAVLVPNSLNTTNSTCSITFDWLDPASSGTFPISRYEIRTARTGAVAPDITDFGTLITSANGAIRKYFSSSSTATITGISTAANTTFYLRPMNSAGGYGSTSLTLDVSPTANPAPPATIVGTPRSTGLLDINWADSAAGDFSYYDVRTSNPTNWITDTTGRIAKVTASQINTSVGLPGGVGNKTYYLRTVDVFGKQSTTSTFVYSYAAVPAPTGLTYTYKDNSTVQDEIEINWNDMAPAFGLKDYKVVYPAEQLTLSSISRTGTLVTVTLPSNPTGLIAGSTSVTIAGTGIGLDGTYTVSSTNTANKTFTFIHGTSGSISGTVGTVNYNITKYLATSVITFPFNWVTSKTITVYTRDKNDNLSTGSTINVSYTYPGTVPQPISKVISTNGKIVTGATYSQPNGGSTTMTITKNAHGFTQGAVVLIDYSAHSALDSKYTIASVTANTITITGMPANSTGSAYTGTCTVSAFTATQTVLFDWNASSRGSLSISGYEVRVSGDSNWGNTTTFPPVYRGYASQCQIADIPIGSGKTWKIRAYDTDNKFSTSDTTVTYDVLVPNAITSVSLTRTGTSLLATITANKPADFATFRLWFGKQESPGVPASGVPASGSISLDSQSVQLDTVTNTITIPINTVYKAGSSTAITPFGVYRVEVVVVDKAGNLSPAKYASYTYVAI